MIRPLRKKIYFAFFFGELKAIDLTFFRFYISWCFVKIKKWNKIQRPAEAILLSLPGLNEPFFFSFPCFLASRLVKWVHHTAGKTRASLLEFVWLQSYVGERESGQCVSSFLKVWVNEVHNTTLFIWFCFQCWEHGFWWLQRCMWSPLAPNPVIPLKRWSDRDNCDLL